MAKKQDILVCMRVRGMEKDISLTNSALLNSKKRYHFVG